MFIEKTVDGVIFYKQPFLPHQVNQILQNQSDAKVLDKITKLFIQWNEKQLGDYEFAIRATNTLDMKRYLELSKEMEEESD